MFAALYHQVAWVHLKFHEFVELFGKDEERVEILNRAAPGYFSMVQDVLFESIILDIAKLLDPATTGKKRMYRCAHCM